MAASEGAAAPLRVGGVEVHVEGDGPTTIVMVHGWPDTWRLWDAQVAALRSRWRCVRFSLPGFEPGDTPRLHTPDEVCATLLAVVDAVSPGRPVVLLLHDWGCVFGYRFAEMHRDRVERIIGIDVGDASSGDYLRSMPLKARFGIPAYQWWLCLAWALKSDAMTRHMARQLRAPADPATIGRRMNYPYVLQWTGQLRRAIPRRPHCPMLYFWGAKKPFHFHSTPWIEALRATPGSDAIEMPTGHWVMVKGAQELNEKVIRWLDGAAS